jgi:translation initiation factor 3 subunit A
MAFIINKPENALRRAKEYEAVGRVQDACDSLYAVLTSRRMGRMWTKAHEEMMIKFIDLCVELREARRAKDGLYHYRQLTQETMPSSLDGVIKHLLDVSARKAADARARCTNSAQLDKVDDLEEEEQAPEALLMGGVTSEDARDRAEREVLLPWVRHMWDTYRNVLETLRNVKVLEHLYHEAARRAMAFCKAYNRSAEFKKLCGMLKNHLQGFKRNVDADGKGWETGTLEAHMATRFVQLEHCAGMALWNEGYRTIEEIHAIMGYAEVMPKPVLMATYYEKLARIFWVSENYLFHAYAWFRFFHLSVTQHKQLSDEDKRALATGALLAALAIPVYAAGPAGSAAGYNGAADGGAAGATAALEVDDERDKKSKLAALLKHPSIPSREALLTELAARGVLRLARPEVVALARLVESEFAPLTLVARAQPALAWLAEQTGPTVASFGTLGGSASGGHTLSQYVPNIERLIVFRLVQQLTAVYTTVRIDFFKGLLSGLRMSAHDVEKLIVRAAKARRLAVRLDHLGGTMRLGTDALETATMRRQLTELAARLAVVVHTIAPTTETASATARREAVFARARRTLLDAQQAALARVGEIERRKEEEELAKQQAAAEVRVCFCMRHVAHACACARWVCIVGVVRHPDVPRLWQAAAVARFLATRAPLPIHLCLQQQPAVLFEGQLLHGGTDAAVS